LSYLDPRRERILACFSFGVGLAEPQLSRIGRQLAQDFAELLSLHEAFLPIVEHFVVEAPEQEAHRFVVFHSLPETRLLVDAARRLGASLALSGRLVGEGTQLQLGANLLDVERRTLLAVAWVEVERESLPQAVVDLALQLLGRFGVERSPSMIDDAFQILGTKSFRSYLNWALACDLERESLLSDNPVPWARVVERLGFALEDDPTAAKPVRRLFELIEGQLLDEKALRQLYRSLERVNIRQPAVGLLAAEAARRVDELERAESALQGLLAAFPHNAQGHFLLAQLLEREHPARAKMHYRQAASLDPHKALYRSKIGD
jgi:hypothetical protein